MEKTVKGLLLMPINKKVESIQQIKILLNYLIIVQSQDWVSQMNIAVLNREYRQLLGLIKKSLDTKQINSKQKETKKPKSKAKNKKNRLNQRQQQIIELLKDKEEVMLKDLTVLFPKVSSRMLRHDLNYLVQSNIIIQSGHGRGSYYKIISLYLNLLF